MSTLPFKLDQAIAALRQLELSGWGDQLEQTLPELFEAGRNGNLPRWLAALEQMPSLCTDQQQLGRPMVQVGSQKECSVQQQQQLRTQLEALHPWRKGPFELFGVAVDTEWRSDLKWGRLEQQIEPLKGRTVLDVGCGNGYYALRMMGAGASMVIGVDPNLLFLAQFQAVTQFLQRPVPVHLIPVGLEAVPQNLQRFDTAFSMGVLYHRRSPIDHLYSLRGVLRSGGELVLETLVIDGGRGEVLVPEGRYAKMRNVWFIPSVEELILWLERVGFRNVRCLNQSTTTVEEQRSTPWMRFESLSDFLDPQDSSRTIEGDQAPQRALLSAVAP